MTNVEILAALDDRRTLALTAWAEARQVPRDDTNDHSPVEELIAVMVVVRNRRANPKRWRAADSSYKAVCLAPLQFSCWNPGSGANHAALMQQAERLAQFPDVPIIDPLVRECLYLADGIIGDVLQDRTGNATSYWAPRAMVPAGRQPSWAAGLPQWRIGDQVFIRLT